MYLKYFGLREAPFNLTPDPKFFYNSDLHREALASLFYGIKAKKGFVVVTGEVGTGKTTLIRKLLRSLEATHHSVFIFNTLVTFDGLLESIAQDLGLDHEGLSRVAVVHRLNEFLLDKANKGHTVSLLIDEAQNLSEDALEAVRLLSNLETDREKLLQIILVGQPELDAKLNARSIRQLKQRVALWCRLDRLSQSEIADYIQHRLDIAGYEGPAIFTKASIESISEYALGTPRLVNALCDSALLTAFVSSKKTVSVDMIQEAARDLHLIPEAGHPEFVPPDIKELERPRQRNVGDVAEPGDGRNTRRGPAAEEQTRSRFPRPVPGPATHHAVHNFSLIPQAVGAGWGVPQDRASDYREAAKVLGFGEVKAPKNQDKARVKEVDHLTRQETSDSDVEGDVAKRKLRSDHKEVAVISPDFFDRMTRALTEAMGPMAPVVVKDQIAKLGESKARFPMTRLPDLMQLLNREILSEGLRRRFEEQIARQIQGNPNRKW